MYNKNMKGKLPKVFAVFFIVIFCLSIVALFYRYIILEDYQIYLLEEGEEIIE